MTDEAKSEAFDDEYEAPSARVARPRLGYLKDAEDEHDAEYSSAKKFGAPRNLPASAIGLRDYVRRVNDQKTSESCVGNAIEKAIDTRLRKLGFAYLPEPSSLGIYTIGRKVGSKDSSDKKLRDEGCYPRDAMKGCRDVGVPSEDAWPFDLANVEREVPWEVLRDASRFLLLRWWRVVETGASRSDAVAHALAQDFPVVFGLEIDDPFFDYEAGTIEQLGPGKGGHMLCILGFRTREDGRREFLVINSWSDGWGEAGYCWILEDVLCSDRATDFYVIEVSP